MTDWALVASLPHQKYRVLWNEKTLSWDVYVIDDRGAFS